MSAAARLGAALAVLLLPRPPPEEPPVVTRYPSIGDAVRALVAGAGAGADVPEVIGFGELHQVDKTAGIPSSLRRFTDDVLPLLAARASDLVVETWVTSGSCGQAESAVVADVEKTTERPKTTESEIIALLRHAQEAGLRTHILRISCADYQALLPAAGGGAKGTVDYQRLLALTRSRLEATIGEALAARPAAATGKAVLVYGGALHNDLYPDRLLAPFSYGVAMFQATGGRYLELDLYVPEYLQANAAMRAERWYPLWRRSARAARPGEVLVIRRSPASAIVVFPLSPPPSSSRPPPQR